MNEIGYTTQNWFKSNLKKQLAISEFVGYNVKTFSSSASDLFQSGFRERGRIFVAYDCLLDYLQVDTARK